jgi:hypothetical protein
MRKVMWTRTAVPAMVPMFTDQPMAATFCAC